MDANIIGVYGGRGQGKSTWVKHHIRQYDRVIVFDPIYEYSGLPGFVTVDNVEAMRNAIVAGGTRKFRICYNPPRNRDPAAELHMLCEVLFILREKYKKGKVDRKKLWILVVEEMTLCATSEKVKQGLRGFQSMVNVGRHWGISIIGTSQGVKGVSVDFRRSSFREVFFAIHDHQAARDIELKLGERHRGKITNLRPHHYLLREAGNVSEGKNTLSRV